MISASVTAFAQSEIRRANSWYGGLTLSSGIVASINAGLAEAGAAIIVFSRHPRDNPRIEAETSYLTYARAKEQRILGLLARLPIWSRP
jgi:hypothetical protein